MTRLLQIALSTISRIENCFRLNTLLTLAALASMKLPYDRGPAIFIIQVFRSSNRLWRARACVPGGMQGLQENDNSMKRL